MTGHRLDPMLRPRSVAVVGASARPGSPGNETLVNLRKGGFPGDIYAVNPRLDAIDGLPCYDSLADLPSVPQHVVMAVGDRRLEACLDEAIALGVEAVSIFSALQSVDDVSPPLRERVRQKAMRAGVLLHGGNCMGLFNFRDGAWLSGFDTRDHPAGGNVALLSQSGAGMSGILDCEERIDFCFAASTGQELGLALEDYLDYLLDQPEVRVIGLFLETSRQPGKLIAALEKARQRRIPIVAIKVGRTELAARLALSHSGALAGSDATYQALFDSYGVQRVDDMAELAAALIMFAQPHPVGEGALVTLHDSGGERQLAVDLAAATGTPLAQLSPATTERLSSLLDEGLPAVNPLDAWGSGGADSPQQMQACFTALLQDPAAAIGAVVHDRAPGGGIYPDYLAYLRSALQATGKPVFLVSNHQGSGSDPRVIAATREGTPVLDGLRTFLVGARCLLAYRDFLARSDPSLPFGPGDDVVRHWRQAIAADPAFGESRAAALLKAFGVCMLAGVEIHAVSDLEELSLEYPLVLKTAAPGVVHKSDVGGVILGLASFEELVVAYEEMSARLGPAAMVAPMIRGEGVEMLLGIVHDEQFGPTVVMGMGGVQAELLDDVVILLPPFGPGRAREALEGLQLWPLLNEFRGRPALAVDHFCEMASRLSIMAVQLAGCVAEVDINPVKLTAQHCIGLDALVVAERPVN